MKVTLKSNSKSGGEKRGEGGRGEEGNRGQELLVAEMCKKKKKIESNGIECHVYALA